MGQTIKYGISTIIVAKRPLLWTLFANSMESAKMLAERQALNSSNAYSNGPLWRRNNKATTLIQ
jgi:hypothetical protein